MYCIKVIEIEYNLFYLCLNLILTLYFSGDICKGLLTRVNMYTQKFTNLLLFACDENSKHTS